MGSRPSRERRTVPRLVLLSLFALAALPSCATVPPGHPPALAETIDDLVPHWRPFPSDDDDSLAYFSGNVQSPRMDFYALRFSLFSETMRPVVSSGQMSNGHSPEAGALSVKVSGFAREAGLLAAINALPFDPSSDREGEPRANVGVVISDGRMLSTPRARYDALVFFADGGAAIVSQAEIQGERLEQISNAVGGFYRLLSGGEPVARVLGLQARHPRSAAGISACGRYLYLLAIDGRRPGSQGATELETALLLRALGAAEGINFDGGGSTALALRHPDGQTRLANVPVHSGVPGRERAVAGLLGIAYR